MCEIIASACRIGSNAGQLYGSFPYELSACAIYENKCNCRQKFLGIIS